MPHFIAALYRDRGLAERVIHTLLDAGVSSGDLSLAVREVVEEEISERDEFVSSEQAFPELAIHAAWERMGWQGGARPAYRDRVPPNIELAILAAGPLAIGLGGAQLGATAGGIIGGITNFGFNLEQAREWYERIVDGQAFLVTRADAEQLEKRRAVITRFQPETAAEVFRPW